MEERESGEEIATERYSRLQILYGMSKKEKNEGKKEEVTKANGEESTGKIELNKQKTIS